MCAVPDHGPCRDRRTWLVLIAAAVRGICTGAVRALLDHLI
jgi:hypothetical protein